MNTSHKTVEPDQVNLVKEAVGGQALVEYSLLIVLVVIVCIVIVTQIGDVVENGLYGAIEQLPL